MPLSNISAISWRPVLVVEEAGVSRENHQPWASNWKTLSVLLPCRLYYQNHPLTWVFMYLFFYPALFCYFSYVSLLAVMKAGGLTL
jgi:hypothetical protein